MGAACMLGGIFRIVVALTVMLMECTWDITLGVPLLLCLMITRFVGDFLSPPIFDQDLAIAGVPLLHPEPPPFSSLVHAFEAMHTPVITFGIIEPVSKVMKVLRANRHNGFPIVDKNSKRRIGGNGQEKTFGKVKGLILRQQLLFMLKRRCFCDSAGNPYGDLPKLKDFRTLFQHQLTVKNVDVSGEDMANAYIDMRSVMNPSPYTVLHVCLLQPIFILNLT